MKPALWIFAALLLCLLAPMARGQALAVFTAAQAAQGKAFYALDCASCHGPDLEGGTGPALAGPAFRQLLTDQNLTAKSFLDIVTQTMPYDAAGNLPDAQFEAIVAYILSRAGYPAGSEKLTGDNPHLADLKLAP